MPAALAWQVQHLGDISLILRGTCSTPERSAEVRRRLSAMDAGCFCVAGAALGGHQSHFAWQVQHSERLSAILRGRRPLLWQVQHLEDLNVILHGRCSTRTTSRRHLEGHQCHFEWQAQHSEHLSVILRGRCSTRRTRLSAVDGVCFCVAGAALGGPQSHFAWQAQHSEHLSVILRGRCSTWSNCTPWSPPFCVAGAALGAPQRGPRKSWRRLSTMHGRCSTRSISVSLCVAGAALGGPPERSTEARRRLSTARAALEDHSLILRGRCSIRTQPMGPKTSFTHSPYTAQHSEL